MNQKIKNIITSIIESFIRNISGRIGIIIRRKYYSNKFAKCGKNLRIDEGVIIQGLKDIYIGDNVWIDKYCILMAGKVNIPLEQTVIKENKDFKYKQGELYIGSNTHIGCQSILQAHGGISIGDYFTSSSGCKIYSLSNDVQRCQYGTHSEKEINYVLSTIVIENNVWLGLNTIALSGTIEKNSFIAPNSVVITTIKENSFASGNPAKKIKNRFENYDSKF